MVSSSSLDRVKVMITSRTSATQDVLGRGPATRRSTNTAQLPLTVVELARGRNIPPPPVVQLAFQLKRRIVGLRRQSSRPSTNTSNHKPMDVRHGIHRLHRSTQ